MRYAKPYTIPSQGKLVEIKCDNCGKRRIVPEWKLKQNTRICSTKCATVLKAQGKWTLFKKVSKQRGEGVISSRS